jgi:hypothetical protein
VTVADFVVVVGVVVLAVVGVVVLVVVGVVVVVVVFVVPAPVVVEGEEPVREVTVSALLVPGCSLATRTPMTAVDAVAATTAVCVIRRRRNRAR